MKCPHCDYFHGWDGEKMAQVNGDRGDFYELSNDVRAERHDSSSFWRHDSCRVYFCPKCGIAFIEL